MKIDIDAVAKLREVITQEGSQQNAAAALEISPSHLGDLLHGRRTFSDAMLEKLGLRRTVIAVTK